MEPFIDYPVLFKSDDPSTEADPKPVDYGIEVIFNTGTNSAAESGASGASGADIGDIYNEIGLYFREKSLDYNTQLDIDGTTMDDLNDKEQPDFGEALYAAKTQLDLNTLSQSILNTETQFALERKEDFLSSAYISSILKWDANAATLDIRDSENTGYSFDVDLSPDQEYIMRIFLENNHIRVIIDNFVFEAIGDRVFDSTQITDLIFKRRKGRFGWYSNLTHGDAYIRSIKPYYLSFGEYKSHPFKSITPINGIRLNAGYSPDKQLFKGINRGPFGGDFTDLPDKSPNAFEIKNTATEPLQGIQTNEFYIDDAENTFIDFELFISDKALSVGTIEVFLWDGIKPIPLNYGVITPNAWNIIYIPLANLQIRSGYYTLCVLQTIIGTPNSWGLDNINIKRRSVKWYGRAYIENAWRPDEADWVPFQKAINNENYGIQTRDDTQFVQAKGQTLRHNAQIGKIAIQPKYSSLGRFIWEQDDHTPPSSLGFTATPSGTSVDFVADNPTVDGFVSMYKWTLGNGDIRLGKHVIYDYEEIGTFPVTLTIMDNFGAITSYTEDVTTS